MASQKRIGFFWGEEKITIVEFEKNVPLQVVSLPLGSKASASSPFSSSLTEEIQITATLKKLLQDNRITGGSFYVALPMKEIILRSFIIPFVKQANIQTAIKFEAKKYLPFDIQDLSFAFHTIPFLEGQTQRLQVIFFAARKEVLARYERIFQQVNTPVSYCEPYIVSLSKSLLFRKESKPTQHLAFLILDKNLGRICFIDNGIPQFIREFPIGSASQPEENNDTKESLNLKIVTEVLNSFDFYARQFNGEPIEQMMVSSESVQQELMNTMETELKLNIKRFSSVITTPHGQSNDMDAIYAMGACVVPPMESLSTFNFLVEPPKIKPQDIIIAAIKPYTVSILGLLMSVFFLIGINAFFQMHLKLLQNQYDQFTANEGGVSSLSQDDIQAETQQYAGKLTSYKNIRTKSNVADIVLLLASHLPKGTLLTSLTIKYGENSYISINLTGVVINPDPNLQIATVQQVWSDLSDDKKLSQYVSKVNLVSFNPGTYLGQDVTNFDINSS